MYELIAEMDSIQKALNVLVVSGVTLRCFMIILGKDDGQPAEQLIARCRKIILTGIIVLTLPEFVQVIRYSFLFPLPGNTAIEKSPLFYGMLQLLNAAAKLLSGMAAVWTVTEIIKGLALYLKGNEGTRQEEHNRIKKTLVKGVLLITGPGLVSAILGYFT